MLFTAPSPIFQSELAILARLHSGDLILKARQNRVTFVASGPGYNFETWFPAVVTTPGSFQASSARLASYFKTAKEAEYTFSLTDDRLTITSESTKLFLHVTPKPWQHSPPATSTFLGTFDMVTIRNLLSAVSVAIGFDPMRPAYSGIFLQIQPDRLTAIAADGARLCFAEIGALNEGSGVVFLTKPGYRKVANLFAGARGVVSIYKSTSTEGSRYWLTDHRRILYVEGSAVLPDCLPVTSATFEHEITFNAADLRTTINRIVTPDGRATTLLLIFAAEEFEVRADGAVEKLAGGGWNGEPVKLAFNSRYVMDFLRVAGNRDVSLSFNDAPGVTCWDDSRIRYFLMPCAV